MSEFTVSWDIIETAMETATGKDSIVMLTEDWFASQDPKVVGKTIKSTIHQINKHYFKYHSSTPRMIKDNKSRASIGTFANCTNFESPALYRQNYDKF